MRLTWLAVVMVVVVCGGLTTACIEVAALLTPAPVDPETPIVNQDDNADVETPLGPFPPSANDNTGDDNTNDNANDNDNSNVNDNDNDNDNANANANDNSTDDSALPDLPAGAEVTMLDSGLGVYDFEVGDGASPETREDTVVVDYVGYFERDGSVFDSGEATSFPLTRVISGFAEGILGMNIGGRRRIIIPPDLGYGAEGNSDAGITGEDVLVFDVTLISID